MDKVSLSRRIKIQKQFWTGAFDPRDVQCILIKIFEYLEEIAITLEEKCQRKDLKEKE